MEEKFDLDALLLPQELPVSLPSKLMEQRPDVRAAEAQWHSACAQVGVAVANMLPQFSITGGWAALRPRSTNLLVPGNNFYSITGRMTQTIFDAGTLLHKKRAAEAGLEQAAAQYRSTVLNAFQNVADTLHALSRRRCPEGCREAERAAKRTLDLTSQLELGANYLAVLPPNRAGSRP